MRMILRYAGVLFALEAVASGLTFLLSDFGWVAALVAPAFLYMLWRAGASFAADWGGSRGSTALAAAAAGLLAQVPGLQGSLRFLSDTIGWSQYDGITDLQDFAMETFHTVFLPLLSALPVWRVAGYYAPYYIGIALASPLIVLILTGAAIISVDQQGRTAYNGVQTSTAMNEESKRTGVLSGRQRR